MNLTKKKKKERKERGGSLEWKGADTEADAETQSEGSRWRKCVIDCWRFTMILPSQQVCVYMHVCVVCVCATADLCPLWMPSLSPAILQVYPRGAEPSPSFHPSQTSSSPLTVTQHQLTEAFSWVTLQGAQEVCASMRYNNASSSTYKATSLRQS